MQTTHSFAINFIKRSCSSDKTKALLYARITVDGERAEISLKERITASDWNARREIIKGKSIHTKELNQYIEDVRYQVKSKYRLLQEQEALITAEIVKQSYLGKNSMQKGHKLVELLDYFKTIWEQKLSYGSFKNYKTTIDYIKLFLTNSVSSGNVYVSQLNIEFITEFEHYVRNNPIKSNDPCLGNGIAKHIQRVKRIINWAVEIGWMKTNAFGSYKCPVKKNKRKKLSFEQLVMLEQKNFQNQSLEYAKDLFLFSCYTGFAFADVMQLRQGHFEWDANNIIWCKVYRIKSNELSPVPLIADAARIINKYKNGSHELEHENIFPFLTNQHINRQLKVIKEICEIDIPLSFHVARHTFAKTVTLKNGVPIETVQMMMGHTKITTTMIYADVDEEKIILDMAGLDNKLDTKRKTILERSQLTAFN